MMYFIVFIINGAIKYDECDVSILFIIRYKKIVKQIEVSLCIIGFLILRCY